MNRQELIEVVATETNQTKRVASDMLSALIDTIQSTVANGERVAIIGFGTFDSKYSKARTGRNIQTGDLIKIPASSKPKFTPGVNFRNAVKAGSNDLGAVIVDDIRTTLRENMKPLKVSDNQ